MSNLDGFKVIACNSMLFFYNIILKPLNNLGVRPQLTPPGIQWFPSHSRIGWYP
jgi:hypothetical protein